MASRFITRELTTLMVLSTAKGTRFYHGCPPHSWYNRMHDLDRDGKCPGGDNAMISINTFSSRFTSAI